MLITPRLQLIAATPETLSAALAGAGALGASLDADVAADWPPEFLDDAALEFTRARLLAQPETPPGGCISSPCRRPTARRAS